MCHIPNYIRFDSLTDNEPEKPISEHEEEEEGSEEVIVHKLNHFIPAKQTDSNQSFEKSEEELNEEEPFIREVNHDIPMMEEPSVHPEHIDNKNLNFIVFQPLFIFIGEPIPGINVPSKVQYAQSFGMNSFEPLENNFI